jgi:hypothetical protein
MSVDRLRLAVVLLLALGAGGARAEDPEPPGKDPFDRLTLPRIKALLAGKAAAKIDGSNGPTNQVPAGTVLVYRTAAGRYGKCKVVRHGYNQGRKWLTYGPDGRAFSKGDKLVVRGTWSCDLDRGRETNAGAGASFWWEQATPRRRFLVPRRKAVFVVYPR